VDITGESIIIQTEPETLTPQITHYSLEIDRGVSFDTALAKFRRLPTGKVGWECGVAVLRILPLITAVAQCPFALVPQCPCPNAPVPRCLSQRLCDS
jgi:hypothetical protein